MPSDQKTPDELRGMIRYYEQQITKTTSADRIRRAKIRIARLQQQLALADRVRQPEGARG